VARTAVLPWNKDNESDIKKQAQYQWFHGVRQSFYLPDVGAMAQLLLAKLLAKLLVKLLAKLWNE
jgi:hypothetical protein